MGPISEGAAAAPVKAFREAFLAMAVLAARFKFGEDAVLMFCWAKEGRPEGKRRGVCNDMAVYGVAECHELTSEGADTVLVVSGCHRCNKKQ